ncbi:helix-turn-helix domain-containing protein [Oenococcus alcoholitolerans]|uniref:helix-turn-helix domain-containing protein n=1 Tax=Oenococcus alcoholitolerans TaxID=931074 RepID=UPI003F705CCA
MELFNLKQLGKNIKDLRNTANMTQEALSIKIDASGKSAINNWEHGQNKPSDEYLQRMATFFKVNKFRILFKDNTQLQTFVINSINYQFEQIKSKLRDKKVLSQEQKKIWDLVNNYYSVRSINFICFMGLFNVTNQLIGISKKHEKKLYELRDNSLDIVFSAIQIKIYRRFSSKLPLDTIKKNIYSSMSTKQIKELSKKTISILKDPNAKRDAKIEAHKVSKGIEEAFLFGSKDAENQIRKIEIKQDGDMSDDVGYQIVKDMRNDFIDRDFKISELKNILVEYFFQGLVNSTKKIVSKDYKLPPFSQIKLLKETLESLTFTILGAKNGEFGITDFEINSLTRDLLNKEKIFIFQLLDNVCAIENLYKDYRIDFKNRRGLLSSYFNGLSGADLNRYITGKDKP